MTLLKPSLTTFIITSFFLLTNSWSAEDCMTCHNQKINLDKRVVPNISEKLSLTNPHPGALVGCSTCHTTHDVAGKTEMLLTKAYPLDNFATYFPGDDKTPNTYELCFSCHHKVDLLDYNNPMATKFRKDEKSGQRILRKNLHATHVREATTTGPEWGKTCKVCHEPHGTQLSALIKDKVGTSRINLEFFQTKYGGQCAAACHETRIYSRIEGQ